MKKMCLILLLLSACGQEGSEGSAESDGMRAEEQAVADGLADPTGVTDPAQLQALVAGAMAAAIPGAKDLQYRNVRPGSAGAVCGEVAKPGAKGGTGPFLPFVVNPDSVALVGTTPAIAYDDPADPLGDAWLRWCASAEELQAIAQRMRVEGPAKAEALVAPPPIEPIDLEPAGMPGAAQQPPPSAVPPADRKPPPPPQIDSFFNSVDRGR
ncbi:hypothetical protein [Allosphingosinicella sp.]|jgi:hypothetical protein|uniref:hypothetical protein n=1 Tax=Allosphingosinicella sp. TaxID=2823234 RepID=UPI002F23F6C2